MAASFTSIAHPIAVDGGLGRLSEERDYDKHVEELVRQVLLTNPGERVNRPDFGCGIRRMLFAPNSEAAANLLQAAVMEALDRFLSTVIRVDEVKTLAREETLEVKVSYVVLAKSQRRFLNLGVAL
jgi:phage baseplate assembly protein W